MDRNDYQKAIDALCEAQVHCNRIATTSGPDTHLKRHARALANDIGEFMSEDVYAARDGVL